MFSIGAIARLKVKNFLTYSDMEIKPGPNLNLIIGPNGSGKSTIVCAICLGLGGKPSVLGRAVNMEDYILYGQESAEIDIDLYHDVNSIVRISREIQKSGSSTWKLNNKGCALNKIETTIKSLNIQVDNLCQFLPQDRVADFVKMTPQELLANTQKAIGNLDLFEQFNELKELRKRHRELEADNRVDKDRLLKEIEKNAQLESTVQNYFDRQKYLDTIDLLQKKRCWVEYSVKRTEFSEKKEEASAAESNLKAIQQKVVPFLKRLRECEKEEEANKYELDNLRTKNGLYNNKIRHHKSAIEAYSEKFGDIEQNLKVKQQDEDHRVQELANHKSQLEKLVGQLNKLPDNTEQIQEEMLNVQRELAKLSLELTGFGNDKENLKVEIMSIRRDINACKEQLAREQDTDRKKMDILRQVSKDAYQATLWLRDNKHQFKKNIYEPVLMTINVHNPRDAKYIEPQIGYQDLICFICEDEGDLELFMKTVKDGMKLNINSAMVPDQPLSAYASFQNLDNYRQYGFDKYVKDMFSAPDAVMRFLLKFHNLQNVPVGNKVTSQNLEQVIAETGFNTFYTPDRKYSVRQSKYGDKNRFTTSSELRDAQMLVISTDSQSISKYHAKIKENEEKLNDKNSLLDLIKNKEQQKSEELDALRQKKANLNDQKNYRKTLEGSVGRKKTTIQNLENSKIDIEEETRKYRIKFKKLNSERLKHLIAYRNILKEAKNAYKKSVKLSLKGVFVENLRKKSKAECDAASTESDQLKEQVESLKKSVAILKSEATKLLQIAKRKSNIRENENLSQAVQNEFGALPGSLDDIDAQIKQEQARLDLMFPVDKIVVREFEERKNEIARMQKYSSTLEESLNNLVRQIDEIQNEWLPKIEDLLSKVNLNFSNFFSRLNCVGEVSLKKADNPLDFEKYGVCIKVKFRDNEILQELTASRQSGGEKSVSTVLYMMALQELTVVPFRCVDEINQGMDALNERKVFEFVLETAGLTTSQYFLLTPKLLADLNYTDKMKVHVIQNGSELEMQSDAWKTKNFLKRARKLMLKK